jgi:hypothetical protein
MVRKSLLVVDRSAGRARYSMLETIRQFAEEQLVASGKSEQVRTAHSRSFAEGEADILALWDSPRQREAYYWVTVEMPNLHTAFRCAADQGDLNVAATIASCVAILGIGVANYEPIALAEELIAPATAVDHPRLAALYVTASRCFLPGRIEARPDSQMPLQRARRLAPRHRDGTPGQEVRDVTQPPAAQNTSLHRRLACQMNATSGATPGVIPA